MAASLKSPTLHSLFGLRKSSNWETVSQEAVPQSVIDKFKEIEWLGIDEFSLISASWIHWLSVWLQKIGGGDEPFSKFNIVLSGEALQLPTVYGRPLFSFPHDCTDDFAKEGCRLFSECFTTCFYVQGCLRADETAANAVAFRRLQHNLRARQVTPEDIILLRTRLRSHLTREEQLIFQDAPCILPYNKLCTKFNNLKVKELRLPILCLKPMTKAFISDSLKKNRREFDDLNLAVGAKIMLTSNINTTIGLFAGASGRIVAPFYSNVSKGVDKPDCLLVQFDSKIDCADINNNTVPIFPIADGWNCPRSGRRVTVRYWPLRLSYALTQFKSQVSLVNS